MMWEHTYRTLVEYGDRLVSEYKNNLTDSDRIASGDLLNSIKVDVEANGREFVVYLDLAFYWKFMEYGVNGTENNVGSPYQFKSERIPIDAIKEWIDVKLRLPEPENLSAAYAMSYTIPKKGIEGSSDLSNAQDKVLREFYDKIAEAVLDDVSGDIGAMMIDYFPI